MKMKFRLLSAIVLLQATHNNSFGQTNTFPANGNVGIGTITPAEKLSVLTATATAGISHSDGTVKMGTYIGGGAGYFGTFTNNPLCLRTNNSSAQVILLQNGNFGIGTTGPTEKLTVQSAANIVGFAHTNGTVKLGSMLSTTGAFFGTVTNHPLYLRTNNSGAQVTLLQNGRVGIGTITPAGKLDVVGEDAYIQRIRVGLGNGGDSSNTCFGRNSLINNFVNNENGAGIFNTAIGLNAMKSNVGGLYNTAVGAEALQNNIDGLETTAVGAFALGSNTYGWRNTAVGMNSLGLNTTGGYNTAVGNSTLFQNSSGESNVGIGLSALFSNKTGNGNIAVGVYGLLTNASGNYNIAIGYNSLKSSKSGNNNTAIGAEALLGSTTASDNTAVGFAALDSNRTGIQNTAGGTHALFYNNGNWNTAFGRYSLYNTRPGADNTAIGDAAMYYNNTGSFNTGIGYLATTNTAALTNTSALGYNTRTTASNQVRLGNSSVSSIGGYVNWTNISDGRVKMNIKENVPGLSFINQLTPVTYNLNLAEADKIISVLPLDENLQHDNKEGIQQMAKAREVKEKIIYSGFIAQDVEKAAKSLSYDFSGVDAPKSDKDLYGLRYAEFVVPLVKSVQELSKLNDEKDATINTLKKQGDELQKQIDELKALITGDKKTASLQNEKISSASLEQNAPNPFNNSTSISYTLPVNFVSAKIIISDKAGKPLKEVNVSGSGKGNIKINTAAMNAGAYQYSLYVNDSLIDTKQMILVK